jgi:hypothetical protein
MIVINKGHIYGSCYDSNHKQLFSVIIKGQPGVVEFTDSEFKSYKLRKDIPGTIILNQSSLIESSLVTSNFTPHQSTEW